MYNIKAIKYVTLLYFDLRLHQTYVRVNIYVPYSIYIITYHTYQNEHIYYIENIHQNSDQDNILY